jgi:type IV pilus assembly protein PilC
MGLFSKEISTKNMVPICRQLATTYDAGIPILRGLSLVKESAQDRVSRNVLDEMKEQVQKGATLGDAARKQSVRLPAYFIELLTAGEKSGRLSLMLRDLAEYYEDQLNMRRSVIGAMVYPAFQLAAAWFLGTFALRLIGQLDFSGKTHFTFEAYLRSYFFFQARAMVFLAVLVVVAMVLSRKGIFQWIWGWFATFMWPIKNVTRKFALARFFRSMSLLIGSGMPIQHCIESSAAITVNPYIQRDLLRAIPFVRDGASLVDAFSGSRTLSTMARQMLMVGEQSGNLEQSLMKVSQYQLEEANLAVKVATRVMNVLILLGIASLVGYIYITFFMTYYGNMMNSI